MFRRRRPLLPLRVFMLAMFALGQVSQPVIASLGDLHELAHDATVAHICMMHADHADHVHANHADHDGSVDEDLMAADESEHAPAGTLHLLMHHAHCCGQSAMTALSAADGVPVAPNGSRPALPRSRHLLQAPSFPPFRPPITV